MGETTAIEWTDATWNPVTGCDQVSEGCDNCYALRDAKRLQAMGSLRYQNDGNPKTSGPGFGLTVHPDVLDKPLRWTRPRRIFVNSMSDLFHDDVPDDFIAQVFAVMAATPRHTFQVLTKRPRRMQYLLSQRSFWLEVERHWEMLEPIRKLGLRVGEPRLARWPWSHVWLGVSVENQRWADQRIPLLLQTPTAVRFISAEPLLGPVSLNHFLRCPDCGDVPGQARCSHGLGWVICGGESGPKARPMHPDWARTLRDQCVEAGVPYLFKQYGEWSPIAPMRDGVFDFRNESVLANDGTLYRLEDLRYPDGARYGEATRAHHDRASLTGMHKVGKKAAGRELDGRTWDEFPS